MVDIGYSSFKLDDGFFYFGHWFLSFTKNLDYLLTRSSVLKLGLALVHPQLVGHFGVDYLVLRFCASDS